MDETECTEENVISDVEPENTTTVYPPTNAFVDTITLELLMNKNHYNRYISKKDPSKYNEKMQYNRNIEKYKEAILELTERLLDDPDLQITTDVNSIFDAYTKRIIDYLQMKEMESADDDTMFGSIEPSKYVPTPRPAIHSYWGKEKIVKKQFF
jgi:hypothetical protein